MAKDGHSKFFPKKLVQIRNGQKRPFQIYSNLSGAKRLEEFQNSQKWAFQIYLNLLNAKRQRNLEWPKLGIPNLFKPVMACNGVESNKITSFLDFKKFFKKTNSKKKFRNF